MSSSPTVRLTRSFWVQLHRWTGLAILAFVTLSGITGALITFDLDRVLAYDMRVVDPKGDALPLDELVMRAQRALPGIRVTSIEVPEAFDEAYMLGIMPVSGSIPEEFHQAYVDPYRGTLLGTRVYGRLDGSIASLTPFLYKLHYALSLGDAGMWFMGLVALLWILSNFIGLYLAIPKGKPWRRMLTVKSGASGYRLAYDLHKVAGVVSSLVLLVVAFSGLTINWSNETDAVVQRLSSRTPMPKPTSDAAHSNLPPIGFGKAADVAGRLRPDHRVVDVRFDVDRMTYRVRLAEPDAIRLRGQYFLFLDGATGALLADYSLRRDSAGDVFIGWQLPLHSGQAFGITGRIIVSVSGLAVVLMAVTGWIVWRKKQRARRTTKTRLILN